MINIIDRRVHAVTYAFLCINVSFAAKYHRAVLDLVKEIDLTLWEIHFFAFLPIVT